MQRVLKISTCHNVMNYYECRVMKYYVFMMSHGMEITEKEISKLTSMIIPSSLFPVTDQTLVIVDFSSGEFNGCSMGFHAIFLGFSWISMGFSLHTLHLLVPPDSDPFVFTGGIGPLNACGNG